MTPPPAAGPYARCPRRGRGRRRARRGARGRGGGGRRWQRAGERRKPHARAERSHGARRDAGDPRGVRRTAIGTADGRRPLRHAGALSHVRDSHLVRAHPAALLRRVRPQRRRASRTARASSASRPATTRPRSTAGSRRRARRRCCATFFPPAVEGRARGLGVLLSAAFRPCGSARCRGARKARPAGPSP